MCLSVSSWEGKRAPQYWLQSVLEDEQGKVTRQLHKLQIIEAKKEPKAQFFNDAELRTNKKN